MDILKTKLMEFAQVAETLSYLIDKFPKDEVEEITFDKWSLKNVVSHLNHWMKHDIDCLKSLLISKEPYWEPDVEEFNRRGVEARKSLSWQDVYKEFFSLKEELINVFESIPEDLINKKIWKNKNETPLRFIEEDIKHWKDEHIAQLENYYSDHK